ncbi:MULTISPECIES: hypothetical protein [Methanobacterium]|uniref:hypothetical protein n=1 Tax=Methanobacterium TaxID=2160 RepID=UPI00074ABE44|nr:MULTISPECIES: hypothetical protein [Methanobacterium]KUK74739.1 MAG: hypothetical protein XD90_0959 [Methanobacterium sp. 42_16]MDG3546283.1 hypothetical protein [Methanobacterium formicicum]
MSVKTIEQVTAVAKDVMNFIKGNGYLPELITFNDRSQVNRATFLRMMCATILELHKVQLAKEKGEVYSPLKILDDYYPGPLQKKDQVTNNAQWLLKDYVEVANRTNDYIKTNKTLPELNDTLNYGKLGFWGIIWTYSRVLGWYNENKYLPKYVVLENKFKVDDKEDGPDSDGCYRSKRYLTDANIKQDTNYWCACNIFQQIMYELYGLIISESEIAKAMGTTKDGTGHKEIISGGKTIAQRYGHNISIEFRNYSDMTEEELGKLVAHRDVGLFIHDLYKLKWGHYEYLIGLCIASGIYVVANSLSGGYIENRSRSTTQSYINGMNQPSIGIVKKIS